jgi:hypothetical protein
MFDGGGGCMRLTVVEDLYGKLLLLLLRDE